MAEFLNEPPVLKIETGARLGALPPESDSQEAGEGGKKEEASPWDMPVQGGLSMNEWRAIAERAYESSSTWFDAAVRKQMERAYAHFHSRHAPGSKYFHEQYRLRSQVFRPKTRSMVRRGEAAVAVALFSTQDLLNCSPWNEDDVDQRDAAEVAQSLLQYRLEYTLPWFQTVIGAAQDAYVHGRPIAMLSWRYVTRSKKRYERDEEQDAALGEGLGVKEVENEELLEDRPWIDLMPVEDVRFDPDCDWRDPIGTSPYVIVRIPMKVMDVKLMIERANKESPDWYLPLDDGQFWTASREPMDSVRQARHAGQMDPTQNTQGTPDYETVSIYRCFFRRADTDYMFDMLGRTRLLSIPRPIEEVYPHLDYGHRPLVMGAVVLEAHKAYVSSPANLVDETQVEINELANLKVDAIRHATLGRWLMRRGSNLDMDTLRYAAPNSVIVTENIQADVRELRQQDIGNSAFAEDDRLQSTFDEISGNFSLASVANNRSMNETVGGMNLLQGDSAQVKEYEIRTFVETFVEPVLNQLYALEQAYETDQYLLEQVCARTGLDLERVLDLLTLKIKVRVNVGFNSTSPERRIQRIALGIQTVAQLVPAEQVPWDLGEVIKEVFGALGYKNGARFLGGQGADPEKDALKKQVQQLQQQLAGGEAQAKKAIEVAKINQQGRLQVAAMQRKTQIELATLAAQLDQKRLELEAMDRQIAMQANEVTKRELILQREALSHEIQQDNREFIMTLTGMGQQKGEGGGGKPGKGKPKGNGKPPIEGEAQPGPANDGPKNLPGDDRAGTIGRGDYGLIPYKEG